MKICSIRIKGFQQFDDLYLDFTNPETGEPVDKICFIGRNGTGKSTILSIILNILYHHIINAPNKYNNILAKFKCGETFFYLYANEWLNQNFLLSIDVDKSTNWFNKISFLTSQENIIHQLRPYILNEREINEFWKDMIFSSENHDLLAYAAAESSTNQYLQIDDVPETNVNNALQLFKNFPYYHFVSNDQIIAFWTQLIFLLKKRENEREQFENMVGNLNKTKKQLIEEFDDQNPKILKKLADLWNKILDKAGLEFDYESASNPIQLNDNLKAYIKLKSTGEKINYNQLSTGIRNFIFRIGHIYSLYFNREIKKGFLLVDEPENSLFPDFLYELIDIYQEITTDKNGERNTQMFFATHNPIIAAQFEPYERILLEWDDKGHVQAFKGKAPAGDDPNDVLRQDFRIDHLMGKKGQEVWQEYLDLKKQLRHTKNGKDKDELISKISKIGQLYNFED
ncbi:MAG: AAA family ATPase [Saprospiraceae bacterium]